MSTSRHMFGAMLVLFVAVMMVSCFGFSGAHGSPEASTVGINSFENPLTVVKLKGGPQASQIVRGVICDGYDNVWHHWVENNGLKALSVKIYEGFAADGVLIYSENIVFEDRGAFPHGVVDLSDFLPVHLLLYNFVFKPVGHKGAEALYYYEVDAKYAPVPVVTRTDSWGTVSLDASDSYDTDGWIVSYEWLWSDGAYNTGPTSVHFYMPGGFLTASLRITDNDGLVGGMIINIGWW